MSTKKNENRAEVKIRCAKDEKRSEKDAKRSDKDEKRSEKGVKVAGPKWGTPEWAYTYPWTGMDRKRRARVLACGALCKATKDFIERLDAIEALAKIDVPGDGYRMCDVLRHLCITARTNLITATYDISYVVDAMVAADLVVAWSKSDDAK